MTVAAAEFPAWGSAVKAQSRPQGIFALRTERSLDAKGRSPAGVEPVSIRLGKSRVRGAAWVGVDLFDHVLDANPDGLDQIFHRGGLQSILVPVHE
jgi:hypothetical protein